MDRWVVPPAVLVAVFTTVVVAPPGGPVARGLRVEALPGSSRGAWLVRAGVEYAGTVGWSVPRGGRVTLVGAGGERTSARLEGPVRGVWAVATVPRVGAGPWRFTVEAEGLRAEGTALDDPQPAAQVPEGDAVPAATGTALARKTQGIFLRIDGGALVPEVPGVLRVRLPTGSWPEFGAWRFESTDPSLVLEPAQSRPDSCGVVVLNAVAHSFDAHVIVRDPSGAERARRRLAIRLGAVSVRTLAPADPAQARAGRLLLAAPSSGQIAHVVLGDASGRALAWQSLRLSNDDNSSAELAVAPDVAWAVVSGTATFDPVLSTWTALPSTAELGNAEPPASCIPDAGVREGWRAFSRASWPELSLRPPVVVFDGAPAALRAREARRERARTTAGILAAISLAALAAVLFAKGLSTDPEALRGVTIARHRRLLVALASTAVLALAGMLLFGTYLLRR